MKRKLLALAAALLLPAWAQADDWNGAMAPITTMYVYPNYVVVVQGNSYAGVAGCLNNNAWSFMWADLDADTRKRVYAGLLAAKLSGSSIRPVFASTGCGPEGHKRFTGLFQL